MPLGWPEMLVILTIVVIIFGAGKLPEVGGAVGKGIKEFRAAAKEEGEEEVDPTGADPSSSSTSLQS